MTEVWFYHLESQTLDRVLPVLLERTLARGWRAVVQAATIERVRALDAHLWTYDDASFLPHGTAKDGEAASQPVYLTDGPENPNGAALRLFVDGVAIAPVLEAYGSYERVILLFDGRDDDAVADARRQWTTLKGAGYGLSYWQQAEDGRWAKRG